ncbi:MAG: 30S ribosomal protein S4 [Candidatus Obscuribacter sp.]|jgi:small subunit ribosomal protein S4|nr:30S ribosomal protein S4 [Candidatus Obscuribacter sp.]MBL0185367.1 30S ribosomal protein S4 [Candidatus Obscuribacter sp.]MBP6347907.1 30S ribosomal protein S4 [Candidatus Obscuribacter sp.]MBP6593726.1 30S ribosomal protein S4 [Candidatus Obscuribacter sp.]MBP7576246.1 30S ribosomal protein S4 [Candidatus Obscuribacter sp.]
MKYLGSICKRVRAVGMTECSKVKGSRRQHPPGQHGADRKKKSDYAKHLMEKQKIRWTYNISEKQFYNTFQEAVRRKGVTGTILLQLLESRLDNVVFRSGLVGTRAQGRQLINHGHFLVNGKPVNIASYRLKPTDKVSVRDKSRSLVKTMQRGWLKPDWLNCDLERQEIEYVMIPERHQLDQTFEESLVIEFYSR